jgi:septum formation protein
MSPLWNPDFSLALGSKSLTRRQLLAAAGLPFVVVDVEVDERAIEAAFLNGPRPKRAVACALAEAKALAASRVLPGAHCIGADQILLCGDEILHKSPDMTDLKAKLARLSGREHRLISAFVIARDGQCLHIEDDVAKLTMRELSAEQIDTYAQAAGDEVLGSVGGYQLEKLGVHLFATIEGDHSTILGLPMLKLLAWLRGAGMVRV